MDLTREKNLDYVDDVFHFPPKVDITRTPFVSFDRVVILLLFEGKYLLKSSHSVTGFQGNEWLFINFGLVGVRGSVEMGSGHT